jgi:small subunit ribosomal protein S13
VGAFLAEKKIEESEDQSFKYIVRIGESDVNGKARLAYGLTAIKGIGYRMACAIADSVNIDRNMRVGDLSDEEEELISNFVENEMEETLPSWMFNRKRDPELGKDLHIISSEIEMVLGDDINRLRKIRSYRGIRHETGQKVRGQRTKCNGRKGLALGVHKRKGKQ